MRFKKLKAHVLVCTNERPEGHPRGSCKRRAAEPVLEALKAELVARGMNVDCRANKSGCLDTCEAGPTVVVYPQDVWYGGVRVEDVKEIVESHLIEGRPVERLRVPGK